MTSKFFDKFLDELEARVEIEDTLKRFIRGVDRQDWPLALSTYHDDAVDEHGFFSGPAKELMDLVSRMHTHQDHSVHMLSNILIEFSSRSRALVESHLLVFQRYGPGERGVAPGSCGVRKTATARYVDVFENRTGAWLVAHRTVVFGDMQEEQMSAPAAFPPGFIVQQHSTGDYLYRKRAALL